jgi:hypothetical protein
MGVSVSGIVIECQPNNFELDDIANSFFGNCRPYMECDTRKNKCVYISKLARHIFIGNADFADMPFKRNPIVLEKVNQYFGKPRLGFAFNWFDSGGTYGYTIIEGGKYRRVFRSLSFEQLNVYGEPLEEEKPWMGGESFMTKIEPHPEQYLPPYYDLNVRAHVNMETGQVMNEYCLPETLLPKVMRDFVGFDIYDMDESAQESKFYAVGSSNDWLKTIYGVDNPIDSWKPLTEIKSEESKPEYLLTEKEFWNRLRGEEDFITSEPEIKNSKPWWKLW